MELLRADTTNLLINRQVVKWEAWLWESGPCLERRCIILWELASQESEHFQEDGGNVLANSFWQTSAGHAHYWLMYLSLSVCDVQRWRREAQNNLYTRCQGGLGISQDKHRMKAQAFKEKVLPNPELQQMPERIQIICTVNALHSPIATLNACSLFLYACVLSLKHVSRNASSLCFV